jgi:hypothetical protein
MTLMGSSQQLRRANNTSLVQRNFPSMSYRRSSGTDRHSRSTSIAGGEVCRVVRRALSGDGGYAAGGRAGGGSIVANVWALGYAAKWRGPRIPSPAAEDAGVDHRRGYVAVVEELLGASTDSRASLRQERTKVLLVEHADEVRDFALQRDSEADDRREARHPQPAFHVADVGVRHVGEIGE